MQILNRYRKSFLLPLVALVCFSAPGFPQETIDQDKEVIAVLGTGDMGDSFGPRLAGLGYKVIYGSRNPGSEKVVALIEKTGNGATAATNDQAAQQADIVFLALPWGPMEQIIKSLGDMEGKTIIDLSWPENEFGEDGYFQITADPSGAEIIQSWIPKAMVVKAFGTTASNVIDNPDVAGGPVTIPIASNHRRAKEVAARIAAEMGLDPVDAGPLRMARNIEAMMALYMVPHTQGRETGWEFYFRRSNYWACNDYTGGEQVDAGIPISDADDLADIPQTQGEPEPCPQ